MAPDYYDVLNASRDASVDELHKAYRRRVRQLHPDNNPSPDASEQFAALTAAYAVLRDPEKRAEFDLSTMPGAEPTTNETIFDKIANAADAVFQATPEMTEEERSVAHVEKIRTAIAQFYELSVAQDTCRAYLLAAVYAEPARSASMEAVTHLYLNHDDARDVTLAAAPPDPDIDAVNAVTAAIISGAAVEFVENGLLTPDPPLDVVDHSTQTIKEVAAHRLQQTFAACSVEPI